MPKSVPPEVRAIMSEKALKRMESLELRQRISSKVKEYWTPERRKALSEKYTTDPVQRFWSHVNKIDDEVSCWEWRGTKSYGGFWLNGRGVQASAYSLFLATGEWPKYFVCHHCDNPPCVRPDHLFDGTVSDNALDAVSKGRWSPQNGANNPRAKLTWEQAEGIRADYGPVTPRGQGRGRELPTMQELGGKYGLSLSQVHAVLHGLTYRKEGDA